PKVGRPWMPGYGVPDDESGAMPWSWARERLERCRNYLVATTRPDGRPHVMPVWGLWHDERFCFSTAITSVKSRNLESNPACALSIEDGHESVVVEGMARLTPLEDVPGFTRAYEEKYGETIDEGPIWSVAPAVAFGFREDDTFSQTATRWEF
ncbi:MAG: pyridoxamine 5'-phosphate oxidase family protein, partial [Candidatus Binatia bacterium]